MDESLSNEESLKHAAEMAVEAAIREGNVEMATKNQADVFGLEFNSEDNPTPPHMTVNSINELIDANRLDGQDPVASLTPRHNRFMREAATNRALAYDAQGNLRAMPLLDKEFIPSDEVNVQRAKLAVDITGHFRVGEDKDGAHYTAMVGGDTLFGEAASAEDVRRYFTKAHLTEATDEENKIPDVHQTIVNNSYNQEAA